MSDYTRTAQKRILYIARSSIELFFDRKKFSLPSDWEEVEPLFENRGTFVTITKKEALRGCIGSILPCKPLWTDVSENAIQAAFHDPRFYPLEESELSEIFLEVSVLTVPVEMNYGSFQTLKQKIQPFIDGVIIQNGHHRATFLPQVWEDLPSVEEFFYHLCTKAGLPGNFYQTRFKDLTIFTYKADIIKQEENS